MGNTQIKPHPRQRNKKQVHWKAAARPHAPGKPSLASDGESTPDLVTIRWNKPINDGGSPISGYLVEHRRAGSPHWVRATPLLVQLTELTISGLEPGWRYQFRVRAENAVGLSDPSELSEPITVTLQRSAVTSPRITQELQDTVALENDKAEFVVHFLGQPAPKICWYKDAFEIFSSRRIRILTEPDRSVLTIHQCSLSDEGEIKCTATNRAGHVSTKAKLTVNAPPSIRLPRQYEDGLLFEIGELIRLKVSIAGRPTPLVHWSHNGESIKNNDRYEMEYMDNSSVLKINDAEREDRGEYMIKAVNKLGEDVQSFLVTVTDKPSPPGRARVVMALGRTVTLSWSTPRDDGGCKIGNYIVEYYRLGWDVWLKAATSRQLTTILGDLIEGSEYKFRIKAESPYGISEPSEESEVVFIPDAKRGILQPPPRSKSQPRDIDANINEGVLTPVARRKHKQRSSSSPRVDESHSPSPVALEDKNAPPKRPMRTKVKSPSKTPEASPLPTKRDLDSQSNKRELETKLNKEIFERSDRSSMARDLAYGSPDIKVKRDLHPMSSMSSNISSGSDKSRTPSPNQNANGHKVIKVKIELPPEQVTTKKTPPASPEMRKMRLSRENSENLNGSSEFMLVLYPDDDQKGNSDFDFGENSIPPPMSLSAPELGTDSPIFNLLKTSASSSELLHERAMIRLYEAAKAEEIELERKRKSIELRGLNIEIPKIQINSKDQQEKLELERIHSFKRRLSGGAGQQLRLRKYSLKDTDDLRGDDLRKLQKSNLTQLEKKELMMNRQRSESEEREEKIFEELRSKKELKKQSSTERRKINIADEGKWADDYVSSTEESSYEDDEEDNIERNRKFSFYNSEDEDEDTYHPRGLKMMPYSDKEPFEILTKRKEPPDPDFIPKPILKKKEHGEVSPLAMSPPTSPKLKRSLSPIPPSIFKKEISLAEASLNLPLLKRTIPEGEEISVPSRPRSSSLTYEDNSFLKEQPKPMKQRQRASSLLPQAELFQKSLVEDKPMSGRKRSFSLIPVEEKSEVTPENLYSSEKPTMSFLMQTISAAATISGITAASIVLPDRLFEKQKDAEEAKVVIDHYGDIVKTHGNKNKNPYLHKSRESLQRQSIESLPRVDESNEELSYASNHLEDKQNNKAGFKYDPLRSLPPSNYQNPVSSRVSGNNQIVKTDNISKYHDQYSTYKVHESIESRNVQSPPRITASGSNSNTSTLGHEMESRFKRSMSPSPETRESKESPLNIQSTSNEPRTFTHMSNASSNENPSRMNASSPELEANKANTNQRIRAFSPSFDSERSRTFSQSSDTSKKSDTSTKSRTFSQKLENGKKSSPNQRTRTFSPSSDSERREKSQPVIVPQGRKVSASPMRKSEKRKTASPYPENRNISTSPLRLEDHYQNKIPSKRKTSPSPMRKRTEPSPMRTRPPMLKEIMTQTSEGLGSFDDSYPGSSSRSSKQEELIAKAEVKVHRFFDYLTDLVMFMVACWLYLFKDELLAIPVLLVLVYRQLQAEISKRIPNWLVRFVRRLRRIKSGNNS